jgi:hypothetical protein
MKDDKMGRSCSTHEKNMHTAFWYEKLKERVYEEDLD